MGVARLGYLGIGTTDLGGWRDIATGVLGMEVRQAADGLRLRMDERPFRFALHASDRDDVVYAGWETEDFDATVAKLNAVGVQTEAGDAAARGAARLVTFRDPEGYANELYEGSNNDRAPFTPSLPIAGFKVGDLGIGHVMRHCARYPEMVDFYRDVLGFRVSDRIVWEGAHATFMRCNPRHHSLALINESLGMASGETNHVMVEMLSAEDVIRTYDRVLDRKLPIIMTLGRHSNCRTFSFYFVGPSGFGVEVGHGGATITDEAAWTVNQYDTTKIWGHLLPHERMQELI